MLDRDGGHSQGMECFLEPFKSFPRGSCLCIRLGLTPSQEGGSE